MSKYTKNSIDLSNELKIATGCEPSAMFCKKVKPDVAAYSSKYSFNLGFKTTPSFIFQEKVNDIWLSVMSIFSLLV